MACSPSSSPFNPPATHVLNYCLHRSCKHFWCILAFYIEHWKYILVICGRTIMSHAGKIVFMVPAGKQVHQFQSTTVSLFSSSSSFCILEQYRKNLLPPLGWAWVSPIFQIKTICSAVSVFQCCPQNYHWVLAQRNHSYYVPQIFGFGCAALGKTQLDFIVGRISKSIFCSRGHERSNKREAQTRQYWCIVPDEERERKQGLIFCSTFAFSS